LQRINGNAPRTGFGTGIFGDNYGLYWKLIIMNEQTELNHCLLCRIARWQYNRYSEESLTQEVFIKYFGGNFGTHFYSKWVDTYKFNLLEMAAYFGHDIENGQKFCDMLMEQIIKYEKRDK
jgi:hypothetical protein